MPRSFSRRDLLAAASAVAVASLLPGCAASRLSDRSPPTRLPATLSDTSAKASANSPGLFGWPTVEVPETPQGLTLRWPKAPLIDGPAKLRFTVASGGNATFTVEATVAGSTQPVARLELPSPQAGQVVELNLSAAATAGALKQGLILRIDGPGTFALFAPSESATRNVAAGLQPHLLVGSAGDPVAELKNRLASLDTLQPFGLYEGCVTEAQWDLFVATGEERFRTALNEHFERFTEPAGILNSSNGPKSAVLEQVDPLPFAALARHRPAHPMLDRMAAILPAQVDPSSLNRKRQELTIVESAYAFAYPVAVIAGLRNGAALTEAAVNHLQSRRRQLLDGNDLYHRRPFQIGLPATVTGKNDSQGMAWWLLGLVRTLAELRPADRPPELTAELARSAAVARKAQTASGVWTTFLDQPTTPPDSAGSAGIAAALAVGTKQGLLPPDYVAVARKAYAGLKPYLTPDGYLAGSVQTGSPSQASSGQVIQPWATGLLGQLIAALQPGVERG